MKNRFYLIVAAIAAVNIMASCNSTKDSISSTSDLTNRSTSSTGSSAETGKQQTMTINEDYDDEEVIYDSNSEFVSKIAEETIANYEKCLFKNGLLCVTDEETGKYGYINPNGEIEIRLNYDAAMDFSPNGLAAVGVGEYGEEKFGFIDEFGNYVISPQFDYVSYFEFDGLAIAGKFTDSGMFKYGYIDEQGNYIIEPKYYAYLPTPAFQSNASLGINSLGNYKFSQNGLAAATSDDSFINAKYGYIDMSGDFVIKPQYDVAIPFNSNGYAIVGIGTNNGIEYGIIDEKGKYVIEPMFYSVSGFDKNGIAIVIVKETDDLKYGIINKKGEYIIEPQMEYISDFDGNGLAIAAIQSSGATKYGFINIQGEFVIEPIFTKTNGFKGNELAVVAVKSQDKETYGFINTNGDYVIEPRYDSASNFSNGAARVAVDDKVGYINESGEYLFEPNTRNIKSAGDMSKFGLALASNKRAGYGRVGFINSNGDFVVDPVFEDADPFYDDGYAIGYWWDSEKTTPWNQAYEFSIVTSDGELISIGALRPWHWRAW